MLVIVVTVVILVVVFVLVKRRRSRKEIAEGNVGGNTNMMGKVFVVRTHYNKGHSNHKYHAHVDSLLVYNICTLSQSKSSRQDSRHFTTIMFFVVNPMQMKLIRRVVCMIMS